MNSAPETAKVERILPAQEFAEPPTSRSLKIALYALSGLVLIGIFVAGLYFVVQEEQKYDAVYSRLGIERLPKGVENMPYIQVDLAKLRPNPCNPQKVDDLATSLKDIGQADLSKAVRDGYTAKCLRPPAVATAPVQPPPPPPPPLPPRAVTAPPPSAVLETILANSIDPDTRRLVEQVQQNPCNQPATMGLFRALQKATDHQAVAQIGETFLANCSRHPMVAFLTMTSNFHLGNFQRSLALATEFQEVEPQDAYWPYWRGRNLDRLKRPSEAADAHLRSLSLWPKPETVLIADYWYTANALRSAGRYCEARDVLERYVGFDPATRRTPQVQTAQAEMQRLGNCP